MRPSWRRELCSWLTRRHSLGVEAALVVALYLAYDVARGLAANDADVAVAHARMVASLERTAHVFVEGTIQRAAQAVPGLIGSLDLAYVSLHLAVTGSVLLWLHRRRPNVFPFVRTTLLVASGLALIGFVVFPTAPPRLAALGIADTISGRHLNLTHGLVSSLYNPYAAVPSMHIGYALVVGVVLVRRGRAGIVRFLGAVYPVIVLFVVVATGNHFLFDAAAGAATAAFATAVAFCITRAAGAHAVVHVADPQLATPAHEALAA